MQENFHEKILLEGLTEGNVKIYDYLFHYYYSGLVAFAMKYVLEKEIAEDIVQEFFYKLWMDKEKLSIHHTLKSYFFAAVKNRCLDFIRHKVVKDRVGEQIKRDRANDQVTDPNFLVESELREKIHEALEKLPEKCRQVFIMNRFEGLKQVEIAGKENISVRTVEGHIGKALKLLRVELKSYLPGYLITLLLERMI